MKCKYSVACVRHHTPNNMLQIFYRLTSHFKEKFNSSFLRSKQAGALREFDFWIHLGYGGENRKFFIFHSYEYKTT